ncbi:MAG: sugar transferase [Candidatus Aquicultor sp.]
MFNKFRAIIESGILSLGLFWSFALIYQSLLAPAPKTPPGWEAVAFISIAQYLTAVFCGYWAGWRSRTDGWIWGIIGYLLFKGLASLLHVYALSLLPFPLHIKLLGYFPVLTLLMFGGVIGEQRARYAPVSQRHMALYPVLKRILDFFASILALLMLAPIMLMVSFIIKATSSGPTFFHQKRLGQHGRIVNVIKFRTMVQDADDVMDRLQLLKEQEDQSCQIKDDPRVFPFGKFLRTTSLDELPQLINIVRGEMSLVGPRPLVPDELEASDTKTLKRLEVKPGLTGLAQINGRGNLTFEERLDMDLAYVNGQSLWLDLKVVLITIWQVLTRHGAY